MAIDIGAGSTALPFNSGANYTHVDLTNPANEAGILNHFEIYVYSECTGVKAGVASGAAPNFTIGDYETLGTVPAGSNQIYDGLNCNVQVGNYAAVYNNGGAKRVDTGSGSDLYYKSGDQFGAGQQGYTLAGAAWRMAFYGTGTSGWQGTIRLGSAEIVNPGAVRLGTQEFTAAQIAKIVLGKGEI